MRIILLLFALIAIGSSCNPISERKQPIPTLYQLSQMDLKLDGKQLADVYCGNCHLKPEPEVLDKATWENNVLPDMRRRMGLYLEEDFGVPLPEDLGVPDGVYAKIPLIKKKDWDKLKEYYLQEAPSELPPNERTTNVKAKVAWLEANEIEMPRSYSNITTLVLVDKSGLVWLGDSEKGLFQIDLKNKPIILDSISTPLFPVYLVGNGEGLSLLAMNKIYSNQDSAGVLEHYAEKNSWSKIRLNEGLIRPVHVSFGHLNMDSIEDYVISHFGNHIGKLSVYLSKNNKLEEMVINSNPGSKKTVLLDFDSDGDLDVFGIFSKATGGVYYWENLGKGEFKERELLKFHPSFGITDFAIKDINQDGLIDIVLLNGANSNLSPEPKNYQGIRVFLNKGALEFEEEWFFPLHFGTSLFVEDFDLDGDLDIVVSSSYNSLNQEMHSEIVFFENDQKEVEFKPYTIQTFKDKNITSLAVGDIDSDGDLDVIAGLFEAPKSSNKLNNYWTPILLIKNNILNK